MTLSTLEIKHAKVGMHSDGKGLYLLVSKGGTKSWIYRYQVAGRRREMGIGSLASLSSTKARALAEDLRAATAAGRDPLDEKREDARRSQAEKAVEAKNVERTAATFKTVSAEYIRAHAAGWKNAKHAQQWKNTLQTYADPVIGDLAVAEVTTQHVLRILTPIWTTKPETATRVRSRVELVLSYAKARGWLEGENPAVWRGHMSALLPASSKVKRVRHHAALDWRQMPSFMAGLRSMKGTGARALEFAILTAARSGEVRGATWDEIDLDGRLWVIPASRMKGGREHRVALSSDAMAVLKVIPRLDGEPLVFSGSRARTPLSDMSLSAVLRRMDTNDITVHGFRSAFRDWASEVTYHHPDLVETALAHAIRNKVEAAYRRGDLLEKRRALMDEWASWCEGKPNDVRD